MGRQSIWENLRAVHARYRRADPSGRSPTHLGRLCARREIQFARGRPYKKDDNAHIEQKNWTHVRKLMGWERYDTAQAVKAMKRSVWSGAAFVDERCFSPR